MQIEIHWAGPFDLEDGSKHNLIYSLSHMDDFLEDGAVYVFARVHGKSVEPLYIGKASNLRRRLKQQFNNLKLMNGILSARNGYKTLYVAWPQIKGGQQISKVLDIVEKALISVALANGHDLLNIQGQNTLVHQISSSGNREARRWLPNDGIHLRRGS